MDQQYSSQVGKKPMQQKRVERLYTCTDLPKQHVQCSNLYVCTDTIYTYMGMDQYLLIPFLVG